MGKGNVCVTGPYEGLYYIDNEDFHVYRCGACGDESETVLLRDLEYNDLKDGGWYFDEEGTACELDYLIDAFTESFMSKAKSFKKPAEKIWLCRTKEVLLENRIFYVCLEDNEWSMAVELIQKPGIYDNSLIGLQKRHYRAYLDALENTLLKLLPSIGTYSGAWTSGVLKRNMAG